VLRCAECPALGKRALYRAVDFAECGSQQSLLLCRVPDKKHLAKTPALGIGPDSGSATDRNAIVPSQNVDARGINFRGNATVVRGTNR
jgi:hypothetical protein